jgi:translin
VGGFVESPWFEVIEVIKRDFETLDSTLREKDGVREEVIKIARDLIRLSSSIVHHVHYGGWEDARLNLAKAVMLVEKLDAILEKHPDLKYSGLVYNSLAEYVEAFFFFKLIVERKAPSLSELKVPITPYLQGLGDLIGEIRRHVVKLLDDLKIEEAERELELMEFIYRSLKTLEYPDALIPGVRHKVDVAARLIEDTRVLILSTKNSLRCLNPVESK